MAGSSAQKRMLERISHRLVEPYQGRRGMCFSLAVLLLCSLIGYGFFRLDLAESNIITVYMLGVLLVAMLTAQWRCWVISSVLAVLLFNCLYAEPRFTLFYYDPQHTVAMLLLLLASLSVGWLSSLYRSRMAEQAALNLRAESERLRVDLLRSVGHDLRTPLTGISGEAQLLT